MAYPTSCLLAPTAIKAPIIPKDTETPHNPGSPSPNALNDFENQFSSFANIAAILALMPDIIMIRTNKSNGSVNARIFNEPKLNPSVNACIPIHKLVDAIPSAAKFPDFRCKAKP